MSARRAFGAGGGADDPRAGAGQRQRDRAADAARGAGDQSQIVFEHVGVPFVAVRAASSVAGSSSAAKADACDAFDAPVQAA